MIDSGTISRTAATTTRQQDKLRLKRISAYCQTYKGANLRRSLLQLSSTGALFFLALALLLSALQQELYWLYALLLLPAAGLLVRLFIIQHDCGHGSFFASRRANDFTGRLISLLTFIPYDLWRRAHNIHHAGSGNLNHRGAGGVDTLTVREYQALSRGQRFLYRLYRHPLVLLVLGPPVYILVLLRFPPRQSIPFLKDYHPIPLAQSWRSVAALNVALLVLYGALAATFGWKTVFLIYLPVLLLAFWAGQWLFFVQHQFEGSYWERGESWNYAEAALRGSSYYDLPQWLHWFTGNIGFHHIHHLCPAIPNYRLQECFAGNKELEDVNRLTPLQSLRCIRLALWDETRSKMVAFRDIAKS